jgi:hypothetical protein
MDIDLSDWMKLGLRQLSPDSHDRSKPERLLDDFDYLQLATFFSEAANLSGFIGITGMPR